MHQEQKEAVLHAARGHVGHVCEEIARSQEATEEELREGREEYRFARSARSSDADDTHQACREAPG
jgi:hypothetical protein